MTAVQVTVLGCGGSAGVPMIGGQDGRGEWGACDPTEQRNRRLRSSIVIASAGRSLLVDTSPDLRQQCLAAGVAAVDAILFTHAHADHIIGVDDVRGLNRMADRPLEAYGTTRTLDEIRRRFDYAFQPWQPPHFYRPVLIPSPVEPWTTIQAGQVDVTLFEQDHGFMPTLGLRIGGFGYSTDAVALSDAALDVLAGVDTWMVGCFQRDAHRTHANLDQVLSWVDRIKPRRTVLTHMGTDMDWAWLRAELPPHVEPAYDGQILVTP